MKPVRRSRYQAYDKQITKRMVENANTETYKKTDQVFDI